jgi:hypothetical protein
MRFIISLKTAIAYHLRVSPLDRDKAHALLFTDLGMLQLQKTNVISPHEYTTGIINAVHERPNCITVYEGKI